MGIRKPLARKFRNLKLRWRWYRKNQSTSNTRNVGDDQTVVAQGIDSCEVVYINLDRRKDRKQSLLEGFSKMGLDSYSRFSAVSNENGALGCASSHRAVVLGWDETKSDLLMVFEDDCEFLESRETIDSIINEFIYNENLDALCLGFRAMDGIKISQNLSISSRIFTTSCYIIKRQVASDFVKMADKSIAMLDNGLPITVAAIDVVWHELQEKYLFAFSNIRCIKQSESYSDILGEDVSYAV